MPLADTDCDVSAFVGGCVNVITGTFNDYEVDLVVPGTEPLVISRSYNNKCYGNCSLKRGWCHNHFSFIECNYVEKEDKKKKRKKFHEIRYIEPSGNQTFFYSKSEKQCFDYRYHEEFSCGRGMTNLGRGEISSRTNPINTWFYVDSFNEKSITLRNGAGELKVFHGNWEDYFLLRQTKKGNGHFVNYTFNKYRQMKEIRSWNRDRSTCYAYVSINDKVDSKLKKNPVVPFTCSDGRVVKYHFKKFKIKQEYADPIPIYYLWKVERPNGVMQTYEYQHPNEYNVKCSVTKKNNPDGRYLKINYYSTNYMPLEGANLSVREQYQYRVKTLESPVGSSNAPVTTHKFFYEVTDYEVLGYHVGICGGFTTVYDAYDRKRVYYYGTDQRLSKIEYYKGRKNHQLHKTMYNIWVENGPLKGALIWRTLYDKKDVPICGRQYEYDGYGNVLAEHFYGNLTGENLPLQGTPSKALVVKGAERYSIYYSYLKDGDLQLKETEQDCRYKMTYRYKPKTDILEAKFFGDHHTIRIREFYHYDHNDSLIAKIVDDGSTQDQNNLQDVTERRITRITPRKVSPIGLPEVIQEFYFNLDTMEEVLLTETRRDYSIEGWLLWEQIFDPEGNLMKEKNYTYDSMGNVIKEVDPLGNMTLKCYDANGNMTMEQNALIQKRHAYDFANRLIRTEEIVEGKLLTTRYRYDYCNNLTEKTEPGGNTVRYSYNDFNRVELEQYSAINGVCPTLFKEYDLLGHLYRETSALGAQVEQKNNVRGQPTYKKDADGTVEEFRYTLDGLLEEKKEKNGVRQRFSYDYQKRPLSIETINASGEILKTVSYTYNAFHLLTETDAEGITTFYSYDGAGRKVTETRGKLIRSFVYDSIGRVIKITEGNRVTDYTYDAMDHVITEKISSHDEILVSNEYVYDCLGNKIQETRLTEKGPAVTKRIYNGCNQLVLEEDPLKNQTHYRYEYKNGLTVIKIDPLGMQQESQFHPLGKELSRIKKDPFGTLIARSDYTYDLHGNRVKEVHHPLNNAPRTILYDYDGMNRLVSLTEAFGMPQQKTTRYTYTSSGQQQTITKPDGTLIEHAYDALDRLILLASSDGTVHYEYTYALHDEPILIKDKQGRINERRYNDQYLLMEETLGNHLHLTYQRDPLGRVTKLRFPDNSVASFDYDALHLKKITRKKLTTSYRYDAGQLMDIFHPDGSQTSYERDPLKRIERIAHYHLIEGMFSYDPVGNLLRYQRNQQINTYTYDSLYQLNSESGRFSHTYTHDALHNRLSKNEELYSYNNLNQREDLNYDLNGNLTAYQGKQLIYDALDRLVKVVENDVTIEYIYDAFHRRIEKITSQEKFTYFYQEENEVGCYRNNVLQELRILGTGKGAEIAATAFIELHGKTYYPLHEYTGSIAILVNTEGKVIEEYDYSAFGEEETTGTINSWRFQGKRTDPETGLVYFGRRYYAPDQGRWISQDPMGYSEGPNLYTYVKNNPLIYLDLYGLFTINPNYWPEGIPRPRTEYTLADIGITPEMTRQAQQKLYNSTINGGEVTVLTIPGKTIPGVWVTGSNGVNNSLEYAKESAIYLSELLGGQQVTYYHNPTNGVVNDGFRYYDSMSKEFLSKVAQEMLHDFGQYLNKNPNDFIFHYPHSEGLVNINLVLMNLPQHQREQILVIGVGTSCYIDKDLCKRAVHINCTGDLITYLDYRGMFRNSDSIIWIDAPGFSMNYHNFRHEMYQKEIQKQFQICLEDIK
ncbi:MAG: hypothetical protein Tsb0021_00430 [Chlamydiales bacterium]